MNYVFTLGVNSNVTSRVTWTDQRLKGNTEIQAPRKTLQVQRVMVEKCQVSQSQTVGRHVREGEAAAPNISSAGSSSLTHSEAE